MRDMYAQCARYATRVLPKQTTAKHDDIENKESNIEKELEVQREPKLHLKFEMRNKAFSLKIVTQMISKKAT